MMKLGTYAKRLRAAHAEHKTLLNTKGKTKTQINRMDTVRKKIKKLTAKAEGVVAVVAAQSEKEFSTHAVH